jgi:hypothetical protein
MERSASAFAEFAVAEACAADIFFSGAFFATSWLKTVPAATTTDKHKINKRLRSADFIPSLLNNVPISYKTQQSAIQMHCTLQNYK